MLATGDNAFWPVFGAAVLVGFGVGMIVCLPKLGSGPKSETSSGPVRVTITAAQCRLGDGTAFACGELVSRLVGVPRNRTIQVVAVEGSQHVVEDTLTALREAGFTKIVIEG